MYPPTNYFYPNWSALLLLQSSLDDSLEPVKKPAYIALQTNPLSREQARDSILLMMQQPRPTKIRWKNSHPGLVARQIWRQAMIINNPSLVDVRSPFLAAEPYDGALSAATFERIATFRHQRLPEEKTNCSIQYAFHYYIELLDSMSLLVEVPLILAWMFASNILPTDESLNLSRKLWDRFIYGDAEAEGCLSAPDMNSLRENSFILSSQFRGWMRQCWHETRRHIRQTRQDVPTGEWIDTE
jgi:hypothetical protein